MEGRHNYSFEGGVVTTLVVSYFGNVSPGIVVKIKKNKEDYA